MVRRLSSDGHHKRSIKIPDVFLHNSKPLPPVVAPSAPVVPYLAVEAFKRQREIEIREVIEKTKSNACNKVADGAKVDDELTNNVTEHTTNRSATNSAATKPQQASRTAEGNTSIKYEPGEVYINEQGKLVRRVRKVKKRIHNPGAPESPPLIPNRPKPRKPNSSRRCTPRSPTTKSRASINSGRPGTKKRRAKPRAAPVDYPVYIGVPSEADARSVQSELNMLSLGDMTPMEIAKMASY